MSSVIDERGRLFGKINLVDLLVLILLVALAVFAFGRFSSGDSRQATIRVTFVVEKVRDATVAQLRQGGEVRDETGVLLGTVEDLNVRPTLQEVPTAAGDLVARDSPVFSDVRVVVKGRARVSSSAIQVGTLPLRVGKVVILVGGGYEVKSQIMGVEVVKQ